MLIFLNIFLLCGCDKKKPVDNENLTVITNNDKKAEVDNLLKRNKLKDIILYVDENEKDLYLNEKKLFAYYKTGDIQNVIKLGNILKEQSSIESIKLLAKANYILKNYRQFDINLRLLNPKDIDNELENMQKSYNNRIINEKKQNTDDLKAKLKKAEQYYNQMNYVDAIDILEKTTKNDSIIFEKDNKVFLRDTYYLLGLAKEKMNNPDEAIFFLRKSNEIESDHVETLKKLGDIYFLRGRASLALTYFKKAYELSGDVNILGNMGICYLNNHEYSKAMEILEKVYEKEPDNINAAYNLFLSYYYLGKKLDMKALGGKLMLELPNGSDLKARVESALNDSNMENPDEIHF
ncbi:MAG: tetratricopeptide repeat protein [Candidatus Muirbacterium halophilum]|nr:tetratricopeptide repeat protein [Candidatus Muirbacterium halophilum]